MLSLEYVIVDFACVGETNEDSIMEVMMLISIKQILAARDVDKCGEVTGYTEMGVFVSVLFRIVFGVKD